MMGASPLAVCRERDERVLSLRLARPKANIVDKAMTAALATALADHVDDPALKAVVLSAEGDHFSFGASVEEHLPAQCAAMLEGFHRLIVNVVGCPVPVLVAVKGQCLGGGLELAMAGHLIFAAPGARLGQPEIRLGVFAPAASALLPLRIPQMNADDMLLSGRSVNPDEALRFGLVAAIADDPEAAAFDYYDSHLAGLSASSLRQAVKAARTTFLERARQRIAEVESQYLNELMRLSDPQEGLSAFLEKRPPTWD